jgi:hypothetical protein
LTLNCLLTSIAWLSCCHRTSRIRTPALFFWTTLTFILNN